MDEFDHERRSRDWLRRGASRGGRPSVYSHDLALFICGEVANGFSLEAIAKKHADKVPSAWTMRQWTYNTECEQHDEFTKLYLAAKAAYKDKIETAATVPYEANAAGRPLHYSPEIAAIICDRFANGETLVDIAMDHTMPAYATFKRWLLAADEPWNRALLRQYDSAKAIHADFLADQIVSRSRQGATKTELMALMWSSSKQAPELYGDRMQMTLAPRSSAQDPEDNMSDEELMKIILSNKNLAAAAGQLGQELQRSSGSKNSENKAKVRDDGPIIDVEQGGLDK